MIHAGPSTPLFTQAGGYTAFDPWPNVQTMTRSPW